MGWVRNSFTSLAMVDYPYPASFLAPLPRYPVNVSCNLLLSAENKLRGLAMAAGGYAESQHEISSIFASLVPTHSQQQQFTFLLPILLRVWPPLSVISPDDSSHITPPPFLHLSRRATQYTINVVIPQYFDETILNQIPFTFFNTAIPKIATYHQNNYI